MTYNNLPAGYYVLQITGASAAAATITYQTDVYDCPSYLTNMTDYHRIFEGCVDRTNYFTASAPFINTHPVFSLPNVVACDVIEIQLDFINPNTGGVPAGFYLEILDSAGTALTRQPAPFGTTTAIPIPTTTPPTYKTFWSPPYAGNFYLRITRQTGTEDYLQVYYLTVYRPNDASKIVTAVDVLRLATGTDELFKLIYFESAPNTILQTTTEALTESKLFPIAAPPASFTITTTDLEASTETGTTGTTPATNIEQFTGAATTYYLSKFTWTATTGLTVGIQSDPYPCPYDTSSTYADLRGVFSHCVGSNTAATLPVITAATIPVYGDSIIQLTNKTDSAGRYILENIATNDVLTVTIRFRHPTGAGTLPAAYNVKIVKSDGAGTFTDVIVLLTAEPIVESELIVKTVQWTSTETSASGNVLFVEVTQNDGAAIQSFRIYELTVNKIVPAAVTLVQATDILRNDVTAGGTDKLFNLIYLEKISTITIRNTAPDGTKIKLFAMDTTQFLKTAYTSISGTATAGGFTY